MPLCTKNCKCTSNGWQSNDRAFVALKQWWLAGTQQEMESALIVAAEKMRHTSTFVGTKVEINFQ